jgi:hypothetical protein
VTYIPGKEEIPMVQEIKTLSPDEALGRGGKIGGKIAIHHCLLVYHKVSHRSRRGIYRISLTTIIGNRQLLVIIFGILPCLEKY